MPAYLVHYEAYFKNPQVKTFETLEHGKWALEALPGQATTGFVIESEGDIRGVGLTTKSMVDLFNSLASADESVVSKFASRAEGQAKLFQRLEEKFKSQPFEPAPQPQLASDATATVMNIPAEPASEPQQETDMETKTKAKKAKTPKAPKEKKAKVAKAPKARKESNGAPRPGSKNEKLLNLLLKPGGATLAEMLKATGWKECRGTANVLARKAGKKLTILKEEGKANRWAAR